MNSTDYVAFFSNNIDHSYDYDLYAYVLMGNHVHLLMETRDIPLSKIMQGINQSYARAIPSTSTGNIERLDTYSKAGIKPFYATGTRICCPSSNTFTIIPYEPK